MTPNEMSIGNISKRTVNKKVVHQRNSINMLFCADSYLIQKIYSVLWCFMKKQIFWISLVLRVSSAHYPTLTLGKSVFLNSFGYCKILI